MGNLFKLTCWMAAFASLTLGGAESFVGVVSHSDFLVKDGAGWVYSCTIYLLAGLTYRTRWQRFAEPALGVIFVVQGGQAAYEVVAGILSPEHTVASEVALSVLGALGVSAATAWLFARFRRSDEIELEATWLAARNDLLSSAFDVLVFLTSTFVLKSEWLQNASDAGSALLILGAGMSIVLRTIRLRQQLALSAT